MSQTVNRRLQRQILPLDRDFDVLPLYVDPEEARLDADRYAIGGSQAAKDLNNAAIRQATATGASLHPDQIESRTALRVKSGERLSFGTYFNAFPAGYWRRWSVVTDVTLAVEVEGKGATVIVYKSMAKGHAQRVAAESTSDGARTRFSFPLPLKPFIDGGWYWYDVVAGDDDVLVASGEWTAEVPADRAGHGTVDIVITTMNRPDYVSKLLTQIGETEELRPYLDSVMTIEQGTQLMRDSEFFPAAEK
jgi:galactofuranosylgalactofuranosylrhamnosyl-N-acetylglucosaminyl-diphospho-decaprenol beta-1,5/1,6-galactofuranosyltransferase